MRLTLPVALLAVPLAAVSLAPAAAAQSLPEILAKHAAYADVHKGLVAGGWEASIPGRRRSGRAAELARDEGWTEVVDCAGSGHAPCSFEWVHSDTRAELAVFTAGEDDPTVTSWEVSGLVPPPPAGGIAALPGIGDDGEGGCYLRWATTAPVRAYAEPTSSSEHIRTVDANRRIEPDGRIESLRVLKEYGRARLRRTVRLDVIRKGELTGRYYRGQIRLPAGSVIQTMWYAGSEGSDFVYDGEEMRGDVPAEAWITRAYPSYARTFEVLSYPAVEEWVRLTPRPGQPAAWVQVNGSGVAKNGAECQ